MSVAEPATWQPYLVAFRRGLLDAGYIEGRNLRIEYRWGEGNVDRLPKLAAELAAQQPAVLVASGGNDPVVAAKAATATIPIVFTGTIDPVESGLVASLNRPGGNVTGISLLSGDLYGKLIDLLGGAASTVRKYGLLLNPHTTTFDRVAKAVEDRTRGRPVVAAPVESQGGVDAAFARLVSEGVDALIVSSDASLNTWRDRIVAQAAHYRLPAIYVWGEYVRAGGLMSYGPNLPDQYRQAAGHVGRILKGDRPADLPVMQPTKFDLMINLKTAKALGIEMQPTVLALADEVIE
jgi:putative ABC transport system substrate-binding protein